MKLGNLVYLSTLATVASCGPVQRSFDDATSSGTSVSGTGTGGSDSTGVTESVEDASAASGTGGAGGAAPDGPAPTYTRCADLPSTAPSGVYFIKPLGATETLSVYCETKEAGGGWALLFNSVGSTAGTTTPFWRILYADRFAPKGTPSTKDNFYLGQLYVYGTEYRDEIEDIAHKTTEVLHAKVISFDPNTMGFGGAMRVDDYKDKQNWAAQQVFDYQLNGGWSSVDHDGDSWEGNCAVSFGAGVTQHYASGWAYNLGADADSSYEDEYWGPHLAGGVATDLNIATDGTPFTRVSRITRWVRW